MADARRYNLHRLDVVEVLDEPAEGSTLVDIQLPDGSNERYWTRPPALGDNGLRVDGRPSWERSTFYLAPIVLNADGSVWPEGTLFLLDRLEQDFEPSMQTYAYLADDLALFKRFIDEAGIDWTDFPDDLRLRPTYRFKQHLKSRRSKGKSVSGANRAIGTVVRFYEALRDNGDLLPSNKPWEVKTKSFSWQDKQGRTQSKTVKTTDLKLKGHKAVDPFADYILDEGKLRPLPLIEQQAVLEALERLGNTEMTLIHHIGLFASARIQTVLTLRYKYFKTPPSKLIGGYMAIPCGPNTGNDTKRGKGGAIFLHEGLYKSIYTYLQSKRYKDRAEKAGGIYDEQFIFLSQRGNVHYNCKDDILSGNLLPGQRSARIGQGVRAFMAERVIPLAAQILGNPKFTYIFHDLRASFGINYLEYFDPKIDSKEVTRRQVVEGLSKIMWHNSTETTELYIKYKNAHNEARAAKEKFFAHMSELASHFLPH